MTGGVRVKFVSSSTVLARSFLGRFRKLFPFGGVRYDGAGCRNLIYLDFFLNRHPSEMLDKRTVQIVCILFVALCVLVITLTHSNSRTVPAPHKNDHRRKSKSKAKQE